MRSSSFNRSLTRGFHTARTIDIDSTKPERNRKQRRRHQVGIIRIDEASLWFPAQPSSKSTCMARFLCKRLEASGCGERTGHQFANNVSGVTQGRHHRDAADSLINSKRTACLKRPRGPKTRHETSILASLRKRARQGTPSRHEEYTS